MRMKECLEMSVHFKFWYCSVLLAIGLIVAVGYLGDPVSAQTLSDDRPWELNAGDLQAVGLHLPSNMPKVADLHDYQKRVSSRQEIMIEWDPHTGYDHPTFRERVAERSLKHDFTLVQRKQNIIGNAGIGPTTLLDLGLEVIGVTNTGEVRGLANGPSLLVRGEGTHAPGEPKPERHDFIKSKDTFLVGLPDDPKIEKLVLLLAHPSEQPRLEQVGVIDLTAKATPQ
jgi:hypothetical protein